MSAITRPAAAPTQPLPPRLAERLPEQTAQLDAVLERHRAAQARIGELEADAAQAQAHDRRAAGEAVRTGRKMPAPTADAALAKLAECQREVQAASDAAHGLSADMLDMARAHAPALAAELASEADEYEREAVAALASAADLLDRAGGARACASWCSALAAGRAAPWRPSRRTPSKSADLLRSTRGHLSHLLAQESANREQREREREREAAERREIAAQRLADRERDAEERARRRSAA